VDLRRLLENGEYGKIIEILSNKDPKSKEEYFVLALSYYNTGKRNKAVNVLKKVLQKDPNDLDALFNLAEIFRELEKWNKAKEYVLEYLKRDPNNWAMLDIACDVFTFEGDYEKAIEYLAKAIQCSSSDVKVKLKEKLNILKSRYEQAKKQKKLAFICAYGLDSFIDDIIKGLSNEYWVRKFLVKSNQDIYKAIDWADIVWLEWANEVAIVGTNYSGIKKKEKVILRLHGYEALRKDFLEGINWDVIDEVIFVARNVMDTAISNQPVLKNKRKHLIPNGIDLSKYRYKERGPGFKIAFLGHFNYKKNPMMAIQILKKLVDIDDRYRLYWAGSMQDERIWRYVNYILERMRIKDHFVFEGWIDDVDEWLEDKDIFLSTSIHEGYGVAIMEAMAKGIKPVIHNFYIAEEFYPKDLIFNTIDEAVEMVTSEEYHSEQYRKFVQEYSLDKQLEKIKQVITPRQVFHYIRKNNYHKILIVDLHLKSEHGHALNLYEEFRSFLTKNSFSVYLSSPYTPQDAKFHHRAPNFFDTDSTKIPSAISNYVSSICKFILNNRIPFIFFQSGDMPFYSLMILNEIVKNLEMKAPISAFILYHSPHTFIIFNENFKKFINSISKNILAFGTTPHISGVIKELLNMEARFLCFPYYKRRHDRLLKNARKYIEREGTTIISYVGIARSEKGFHILPHLAEKFLSHDDVIFYIQIPPPTLGTYEPAVQESIIKLKELPNVQLIDSLNEHDYEEFLLRSDFIYVLYDEKSYYGRLSYTYMEAISSGSIPILNKKLWFAKEVEDTNAGVIVENPFDVDETYHKVISIIKGDQMRRMKENAISLAQKILLEHNTDIFMEKLIGIGRERLGV